METIHLSLFIDGGGLAQVSLDSLMPDGEEVDDGCFLLPLELWTQVASDRGGGGGGALLGPGYS